MVEVKLPEADISSGKYTEYSFETADAFYDVLLNFDDTLDKNLASYYPAMHGQNRWVFRGHWDNDWELIPSIFRKGWHKKFLLKPFNGPPYVDKIGKLQVAYLDKIDFIKVSPKNKLNFHIMMELILLERFMETANSLGIKCNYTPKPYTDYERVRMGLYDNAFLSLLDWPDSELWPLMALAQHHGVPTRLLDFTRNPFFAAFFAASYPFFEEYLTKRKRPKKNKKMCIWGIDKKNATHIISMTHDRPWQEIPTPSNRSSNLFAQEGLLMLDRGANDYFITKKKWRDFQNMGQPDCFVKFTLPQSEYKNLLRRLWENDITPAQIMPNLDRVAQTLEYNHWLWTEKQLIINH